MPIHAPTLKDLQFRAITFLAIFLRNAPQSQAKAATPDEISSKNAHDFRSFAARNPEIHNLRYETVETRPSSKCSSSETSLGD